jgi:hypothetical protein
MTASGVTAAARVSTASGVSTTCVRCCVRAAGTVSYCCVASSSYTPVHGAAAAGTGIPTTAAAAIASSASTDEAMASPTVAIAPIMPGANAKEDAVIEIPGPIKTVGSAGVGRVVVVAPLTDWRNA